MFEYLFVLISIIVGLALAQLLGGLGRLITAIGPRTVYLPHLVWSITLVLLLIAFWWWEYRLNELSAWYFEVYVFVVLYAVNLYLLTIVLMPPGVGDSFDWERHFLGTRRWFFGLLSTSMVMDVIDTIIKGDEHVRSMGNAYWGATLVSLVLALLAMWTGNRRFHAVFALFFLVVNLASFLQLYRTVA